MQVCEREMHLCRSSSHAPGLPTFLKLLQNPHLFLPTFGKVPLAPTTQNHILTSKSGPRLLVLNTFDFKACFAPQRHALFEHKLPKVLQEWCASYNLSSTFASRIFAPQRVHFFKTSTSKSGLRPSILFYTFDIFWLPNVLGQSSDFQRGVAFWSIRSSGLLRWFCMAGAALRMTWHHFLKQAQCFAKTHGLEQLQTTPHHTTLHSAAVGDHSNKHNSDHLLFHQWICSAIHASQQLTSPIVVYLWNFRHRLVRYYWYKPIDFHSVMHTV